MATPRPVPGGPHSMRPRAAALLVAAGLIFAAPRSGAVDEPPVDKNSARSVVKIIANQRHPELMRPWMKQAPQEVSGTGVVIEGDRILTSAYVVRYSTEVLVQVDAAINQGNSGGPAVIDDAMISVIFSHMQQGDNIGYIIPNEEIDLFLEDVADGRYDGKPAMYDILQYIQNDAL